MMLKRLSLLLSVSVAAGTLSLLASQTQQTLGSGSLLVLSKGDLSMSVVDPTTL